MMNTTGPAQLLIAAIWQGLLLTACVWAGLKLADARGVSLRASTRFTLWLIVFLLVACLPGFALAFALLRSAPASAAGLAPAAVFSVHLNPYWAFAFEGLWVISSLFSLVRLWSGGKQMRTLYVNATPVPFGDLEASLQSVVARPGQRPVQIRLSEAIDAPSVIGFFRPAVMMPLPLWKELTQPELKQIVLHEIAHLDRRDDWTNLLQKLLRAICPLNPALFWAERHLCQERERACDDAVLDAAGNARAYATCLTKLAENRLVRHAASLAPGLWQRSSELAVRVDNILHRRPTLGPLVSRGLLAASLLATMTVAILLQRCPGLVAFTNNHPLNTLASPLASTTVVPVDYRNHGGAIYHDAVFHPQSRPAITPAAAAPVATRPRVRKPHASYRFVQIGNRSQDGEVFTLIMFTVEVPRPAHGAQPVTAIPVLTLSDNWIAFRI